VHAPQPCEHADGPRRDLHLAEPRDLLAELPVALLRPGPEEGAAIIDDPASLQVIDRLLDDGPQPRAVDTDEGVSEIERDRADGETAVQRAALDGQMSRNGQYVQASTLGFGV
jgi:hypothetical protein